MNYFKRWNGIVGWLIFLGAAVTYLLTIEPTASLWDCPEFIATSYKLEVGHPPGAPLFMLIARFFTLFAPSTGSVAAMVNSMSALCSAATILFLFWSITHMARRIYRKNTGDMTLTETIVALGAGAIGAIAYTFTDTFWFSAVEGEVYAMSSLFTAVVVWAMLKWEDRADDPHADRWLILIAYLMGLSIGVHILNLLTIPAIVFIYYFRKTKTVTFWGVVKTLLASGGILLFINYIIIPYTTGIGAFVDRIFVNSFGAGVNVGMVVFALLLLGGLGWAVWFTYKRGKRVWNVAMLCLTVIVIGYSSYAAVVIRAQANPPMNSGNPDNPYGLLYLLDRDQYGNRPLVYGVQYSAPPIAYEYSKQYFVNSNGRYEETYNPVGLKFPPEFTVLFPRMWSSRQDHIAGYKSWGRITNTKTIEYGGERYTVPTPAENARFFLSYQLDFMFWRYFMWNFAGRQNDTQSNGEIYNGQWLSGIRAIDQLYLGPQSNLPSEMKDSPSRNTYYFLPFILGLLGLFFQLSRDNRNFTVVMTLFILMGVALVVYFNITTGEPRERDYVFAGAFYAFAIWIGFGVMCIAELLGKALKKYKLAAAVAAVLVCVPVPVILGAENWDDHDRSHRYTARDIGYNYLVGLLPNSIIMNYGDNDTFPLWYNQEVEGIRPDVRIMNTSYLGGGWYIDEMTHRYNDSAPVPFSLPRSKYIGHQNDMVLVADLFDVQTITARQAIDVVALDDPRTRKMLSDNATADIIPAHRLAVPVNKAMCLEKGIVKAADAELMVDTMYITLRGDRLDKPGLMLIDLLATFNWERPLYFTQPAIILEQLGLMDYLQFDGYAYRLVPILTPYDRAMWSQMGRLDIDVVYSNLMEKFNYGNVSDPRVNVDYFVQYNFSASRLWLNFARLADALSNRGDTTTAVKVLDYCMRELPVSPRKFHWNYQHVSVIRAYYNAGAYERGDTMLNAYAMAMMEYLDYYSQFTGKWGERVSDDVDFKLTLLSELWKVAYAYQRTGILTTLQGYFDSLREV